MNRLRERGMITAIVIIVLIWTIIRIVQFVGWLWRLADAPRIGVVPPT
jgi:Na+/H+ antiporter NhaC